MGTGGSGFSGFSGSVRATFIALTLLAGSFGALLAVPEPVAAQAVAPWYGSTDKSKSTEGWSFRIPVTVENDRDYAFMACDGCVKPVVHASFDFGKLLVEAGWINQTAGNEVRSRGFTLDPASIRVVEYDRGFRDFKERTSAGKVIETPYLFYPSLFEKSTKGRDYDASTNPIGTVMWEIKGGLRVGEKRFFYVYFNALQYGKREPPAFKEAEMGPLEAFGWSGAGQVFYGFEVGASGNANRLNLLALFPETKVWFYLYELGQYKLYEPPKGDNALLNPIEIRNATNQDHRFTYTLPQSKQFKIVASKPIVVGSHGAFKSPQGTDSFPAAYGSGHYAVGTDGQYASRRFFVPIYANDLIVYAAEQGSTNVCFGLGATTPFSPTPACVSLSTAVPARSLSGLYLDQTSPFGFGMAPTAPTWMVLTATKPVLLQYANPRTRVSVQAPALSGAPSGTTFLTLDDTDDHIRVQALGETGLRVFHPESQATQVFPPGPLATTSPYGMSGACGKELEARGRVDLVVNQTFEAGRVLTIRADPTGPAKKVAPLVVETGGPRRLEPSITTHPETPSGYYGGAGGQRVYAQGPLNLVGYFNETKVKVRECTDKGVTEIQVSLNQDSTHPLVGPGDRPGGARGTGWYEILSSKPVSAFSTYQTDYYARFLAGRQLPIQSSSGGIEFRAPLVDLRSAERPGLQVFKTTGPKTPVDFKLTAYNLGQWIGGENLPDAVKISCAQDKNWEIKGCDREIRLNSRAAESFTVTIIPHDAASNERGLITVTATSTNAPNVTAQIRLFVLVEVAYGVGLWFDVEGGLKLIDPPVSVSPADKFTYKVVVKNTGSVSDTFLVERVQAADPQGWSSRLYRDSDATREVDRITLEAGASETLKLEVTAPESPILNYFDVTVKATSIASAAATDKVVSATRIRADIRFQMTIDERTKLTLPGKPAQFLLSLLNKGNDIARIGLEQGGLLPPGWTSRIVGPDGKPLDEINLGLGPPFNVTLEITPPAESRAGEIATVRVTAETTVGEETRRDEQSATAVVRQVHNVTVPEPGEFTAVPGETIRYLLDLTNLGNGDERIEIVRSSLRPPWPMALPSGDAADVPRGDSATLELLFTVPPATPSRLYELNLSLRLSREEQSTIAVPVFVKPVRQLSFSAPAEILISPGQEFAFPLDVKNTGNIRDVATLGADLPAGWKATFDPPTVLLNPDERTRVTLLINASREARDGVSPIAILAAYAGGGPGSRGEADVRVARPDLSLGEPIPTGTTKRGDLLVVAIPVLNTGGMEAKDVRVALLVNDEVVDNVVLNRILPGEENARLVTLKWLVDRDVTSVTVKVNPDASVVESDLDGGRVATVTFAKKIPAGGAAAATLALLAASLAVASVGTGRRRLR